MALELSLRSAISLLLLATLAIAGCDKRSGSGSQANETMPTANGAAAVPARAVDRSHKGEAAPDFAFLDPEGKKTMLAAFRGKPALLNLWATWCVPCRAEMPTLDALAGQRGDALTVITLSQDGKESVGQVLPYFTKSGFKNLKPWTDPDMAFSLGMNANLPTTILYDSAGREVWRVSGDMDWAGAKAAALLAEAS
ncbi:MAG: thioredoxin [Sphingomonas sp. 67-41]|nr:MULTISPECIES: TlpA disulfide reductase family protein [unclassified Sphingomonas]MBN8809990.1 TlpA family protein disulfide reductase [Sphingomonas sp.]OJY50585.1 MAG: thioredoxin [Sphingomonas sp. 67-41]